MEGYRFISDLTFEAYGNDLKELFENAALALCGIIYDINKIKPKKAEEFEMKGEDLESTMFNWLNGIITIIGTEKKAFSKLVVEFVNENCIRAKMWGEPTNPGIIKKDVIALDAYKFKIEKTKDGYKATIGLKTR